MTPDLQWIDWLWPTMSGACATLALVYGSLWVLERRNRSELWFALAALGVGALGIYEHALMRATDAESFLLLQRQAHVPMFTIAVSLAFFTCSYFQVQRPLLVGSVVAARLLILAVDFLRPHGVNFRQLIGIETVELPWSASATVANAVPSAWSYFVALSWLLIAALVASACHEAWRRGDGYWRRRAIRVGSSMLVVVLSAPLLVLLLHLGMVRAPYFNTPIFLVLIAEMGGELVAGNLLAKNLSRRLHESQGEMELAAGFGLAPWVLDLDRGEVRTNAGGRDLFGFEEKEPMAWSAFLDRVHLDDRKRVESAVSDAVAARHPMAVEFRLESSGGRERWFSTFGGPDLDDGGRLRAIRGIAHETTTQRHTEQLFRLVVDATPAALLTIDGEGRVIFANLRAHAAFGYAPDELIGVDIDQLLPDRLRSDHGRRRRRDLIPSTRGPMGIGHDLMARRKDGTDFPVEIGLSPISSPRGPLVLATVIDISDRRQLELGFAQQRSELAHLSRIGILGELSASIAHELNQPLSAILANAQAAQRYLAREPPDLELVREIVGDIVEDDKRAGEVIRRLRAMLRKEELVHLPVDLNEVVSEVLYFMHSDFVNRGVTVEAVLARDLPRIAGDRIQLQQVLLNLIINGCDSMASIPRPRRLTVRSTLTGERKVELMVSDHGGGIAEADLERIFEPFVTTKAQGTGLGLSVCRTIIGAHDGRIWARNNESGGAAVLFALPVYADSREVELSTLNLPSDSS